MNEDWVKKLSYLYWYETVTKNGWKLTNEHHSLYEKIKQEVMHHGYEYFEHVTVRRS